MRLGEIVEAALGQMFGRMLWRAAGVFAAVVAGIAAIYHLTIAGTLALELRYGALEARVIVGVIYLAVAALVVLTLWVMRKPRSVTKEKLDVMMASPRTGQIAMMLEAAIIGFAAGKKTPKSL